MNAQITITDDVLGAQYVDSEQLIFAKYNATTDLYTFYCNLSAGKPGRPRVTKFVETDATPTLDTDNRNIISIAGKGDFADYTIYIPVTSILKTWDDGDSGCYIQVPAVGNLPTKVHVDETVAGVNTAKNTAVTDAYEEQAV